MPKGFLGRVSVSGMSTLLWWSRSTSTWAEVVSGHDKMDPGKLPAKVHITFFGLSTHQCTKNSTMGLLAIGRYSVWLMPQTPKQLQFRVLEISSEAAKSQATLLMVLLWAIGLAVPFGQKLKLHAFPNCKMISSHCVGQRAMILLFFPRQVFFGSFLPSRWWLTSQLVEVKRPAKS